MGCGKICKAKKKAKKAKKQAAAANRKADAARRSKPTIPGVPQATGTSVEVTTVADVLGVGTKYQALTPYEAIQVLGQGRRNSQVMNSAARGLVGPIQAAFGVYLGVKVAQAVPKVVKPIVKMASQIGDLFFNFAAIGELIADIAILVLTIFVGLAPIFLSLLRNLFFNIPVDIGILTEYQMTRLKELVQFAKIEIKAAFQTAVLDINAASVVDEYNRKQQQKSDLGGGAVPPELIDFTGLSDAINTAIQNATPPFTLDDFGIDPKEDFISAFENGMNACREQILENLGESLKGQKINILQIPDVATFDKENKLKAKNVAKGLNDASKRIEVLQAGEVLKRQFTVSGQTPTEEQQVFDDNDLAVAAAELMIKKLEDQVAAASAEKESSGLNRTVDADRAFLEVFNDEVEKKKGKTVEVREDLEALNLAQDIILGNKNQFVASMINVVKKINLDNTGCVNLDPCYENTISTQFSDLKSTTQTQQTAFINDYTVNDTTDMINLKDSVYANVQQSVNDANITVDPSCQESFGQSVCDAIDCFKSKLFAQVKVAIENGSVSIDGTSIPSGINKYELKKMLDYLLKEVKKKLLDQARDVIVEEVVPCKACKPCEEMIADIGIYVNRAKEKSKDNIIKHVEGQIINNTNLDWTITDSQSITNKKNQLISHLNMALLRDAGELQLVDDMLFRLKAEEKELIKNVVASLQAIAD